MDPLSDVLSLLKPRNHMAAAFDAAGEWSIQFVDQQHSIKCGAVANGRCWLTVEGVAAPVLLDTGDCFLLPAGRPFRMATDLGLAPVEARQIFPPARSGGIVTRNGGGEFFLVSARFMLEGAHAGILLGLLPPIIHIRDAAGQAALRWSVERMIEEMRDPQPGGFLLVRHHAHMVLLQALRLHLSALAGGVGWLFALGDRQIGTAIAAIHGDPARRWTLPDLAAVSGMSRSAFALRFKDMVGSSPMEYLTRWRMLLAGDRLANSGDAVSSIALSLGYESESAFSTAFKRVMGCPPRSYVRRGRSSTASLRGS